MSNKVSAADVAHVATLANLTVSKVQQQQFATAFTATLQEIDTLQDLDTSQVKPTHQVSGLTNLWRKDKVDQDRLLTQEQALSQAEHSYNGYVVVDRIIEEE